MRIQDTGGNGGFNPMQMLAKMFNGKIPQFDEGIFREMLPKLTDGNINQIVDMARNFGMPERQIEDGIRLLRQFRK
jgi:hypothetical protein